MEGFKHKRENDSYNGERDRVTDPIEMANMTDIE